MANIFQIKPYIHDFIEDNLDNAFKDKVYWIGERKIVPTYPYCLLSVISENKDKRTSHHIGRLTDYDTRKDITTRYKTATITVGIYNAWVEDTDDDVDMDEAKEFAYEQIDYLEGMFENYPINKKFSVQNISSIRPLHEVTDGGYMYRYEFDLTVGYNEKLVTDRDIAENIEVDMDKKYDHNSEGADNKIYFNIELVNDTVTIDNLI